MFRDSVRNGFGLGLIVGICLTLILCLWASVPSPIDRPSEPSSDKDADPSAGWELEGAISTSEDTLAQWSMAILALIAVGVSYWGITLLKRTLDETAKASNSAAHSVTHLKESTELQNRPWINIAKTEIEKRSGILKLKVTISNKGQTPAKDLRTYLGCAWVENPRDTFVPIDFGNPFGFSVLMREETQWIIVEAKLPIGEEIEPDNFGLCVTFYGTYRDVFKKRRKTLYTGWISYDLINSGQNNLFVGRKHNRCT